MSGRVVEIKCRGHQETDGTYSVILEVKNIGSYAEAQVVGNALHKAVPTLVQEAFAAMPHVNEARLLPSASSSTDTPQ